MAEAYSSWVAGHSVVAQSSDVTLNRVGWGTEFTFDPVKFSPEQYFHFSIPTPTVIHSRRSSLVRVMLLIDATFSVAIDRVDLWDGGRAIGRHDVHLTGDYRDRIVDGENIIVADGQPQVGWGLGVSLHVVQDPQASGAITFFSAGADFSADV
jgi:hypothetical protein